MLIIIISCSHLTTHWRPSKREKGIFPLAPWWNCFNTCIQNFLSKNIFHGLEIISVRYTRFWLVIKLPMEKKKCQRWHAPMKRWFRLGAFQSIGAFQSVRRAYNQRVRKVKQMGNTLEGRSIMYDWSRWFQQEVKIPRRDPPLLEYVSSALSASLDN